jgi:copper homeostasis protein
MPPLLLEVIATSVADAVAAAAGGADRLEVVRDLARGGLTPAIGLVDEIQRAVTLPLRVMIRETDGFACESEDERRRLVDSAAALQALGVSGIVVGWTRDDRVDEETLGRVLDAAPSLRATFHRAFDGLTDPETALRTLARYPQIDRVLTSAGAGAWALRCARLAQYARWSNGRIGLLPGGGIDAEALRALAASGDVDEAHVGRAARTGGSDEGGVSYEAVRRLRRSADGND